MTLSIIVPVFNSEYHISKCIDSILSQSYTDFEILLIDDGSTDSSGSICDCYADKDKRVKALHKNNGGVCSARNFGIEEAKGDYIVFIDADDYIGDCCLGHLMSFEADLVLTGIKKFGVKSDGSIPNKVSKFTIKELPLYWNTPPLMNYLYCYSVARRFRGDIIRNNRLRFNESLIFSEDMCFNMSYYSYAKSFVELPYADYMYRIESLSRDEKYKMSAEQLGCHFDYLDTCFQQLYKWVEKESLSFVRDNTNLRLMRKFYFFLMQDNMDLATFVQNIKSFRKRSWASYMMSLLKGRKEKRVMREALFSPYLAFFIENRLQRVIARFNHQ